MIEKILEFLRSHPDSSFQVIKESLGVPVDDFKADFDNLKSDKYLSHKSFNGHDQNGNPQAYPVYRITPKGLEFLVNLSRSEDYVNKGNKLNNDSRKIFVSHSYIDRKIADRIINKLLLTNLSIDKEDIFYTSKRETGIAISLNWRNIIKQNIKQCKIYIALITTNFLRSEMCLNELGAAWVLDKKIYPIILPPVKLDSFSLLISDLQALNISEPIDIKSFLKSLQVELKELYDISPRISSNTENEINKYGKSLRQYLRRNPSQFKTSTTDKYDRRSDLNISHYIGIHDDEMFKGLELKYLDISIENTSKKSIDFDIEMKVHKNPNCQIILQRNLKELINKQRQESRSPFDFGLANIEIPSFDFDIHSKETKDYILVYRIKTRNQKTAIQIAQQDIEEDIFNKNVIILEKGETKIRVDIVIRSDDFTEGIFYKTLEV